MNNKKGFTLIELLVVIAIIGILALLILPNFISSFRNANNKAMITQENEVVDATKLFVEDYCRHPLKQNKGKCSTYSMKTENANQKYTCLSTLQTTKYMEDIVSQGQFCSGFVVYNKNYSEYKAYLKCGNGYATEGIDEIMDSHNNKLIDICLGEITPEPDEPDEPDEPTPSLAENYENTATHKIYETLNDAFSEAQSNQTIKVLQDIEETLTASIFSSSKTGIKLDLNGKTISSNTQVIANTGELDIYSSNGEGIIEASIDSAIISNKGTLTVNGTSNSNHVIIRNTSSNNNTSVISNGATGKIILNSNSELSQSGLYSSDVYRYILLNEGLVTINGATLTNTAGNSGMNIGISLLADQSRLVMNSGSITTSGTNILNSNSTQINPPAIEINGGSITNTYIASYNSCIVNNNGKLVLNDGTITGARGIDNTSNLEITGNNVQINASSGPGIQNLGTLLMSGGTITAGTSGISCESDSNTTITGGTIKGKTSGLVIYHTATLTLGTNDSNVSTTSPLIQGIDTSNSYGIKFYNGTLNFYDGIIKSSSGTGKAIDKTPTNVQNGYEVYKETVSGVESAYLKRTEAPTYTATFYYNSNPTAGSLTVSTSTATCIPSSGSCTVEVPSEVSNSVGKYNSTYKGVSTSTNNMNSSSLTISANTTFYANYSKQVLVYYYGTSYTSKNYYRNEYFTSNTAMASRLATSNTGTANYSTATGPGSSVWYGLSTGKDAVREYETVQQAANSRDAQLYSVYSFNVTFAKGANVSEIGSTSNHCEVTSTNTSCEIVLPSITPASGYASVGWNTTSGATTGTDALGTYELSSNPTTLYANAKADVGILMAEKLGYETSTFLRTTILKQDIESLTFTNSKSGHTANGTDCWDVSRDVDGGVLAWAVDSDSDGKYEMTIGANGTIYASNGNYLFEYLINLDSLNGMNNFDTSNVTSMQHMFQKIGYNSTSFTLDLGSKFDTSKVTDMSYMFHQTGYSNPTFTLDLGDKFDTSNVKNMYMMFDDVGYNSTSFTLNLGNKFDTSNVTNMRNMFSSAGYSSTVFTLDLGSKFDTSNVTSMYMMFNLTGYNSTSFTLNLGSNFNTSKVTNMSSMFSSVGYKSTVFTLDLGDKFDTSNVTAMGYMFHQTGYSNPTFTLDLGDKFDTSNVTNMGYMFSSVGYSNTSFTLNLGSKFDTSNVTKMDGMFCRTGYSSTIFTLNLGNNFYTSKVTDMKYMFDRTGYSSATFNINLGNNFDTSNVTNMRNMFYYSGYNNRSYTLNLGSKFDTSKVTNMSNMFAFTGYKSTTFTINLGNKFNTSNVTDMSWMFYFTGTSSTVFTLDLGDKFDTSSVTNMSHMFYDTGSSSTSFNINLGDKFDTSKVTNMLFMFYKAGYNNRSFTLDLGNKFNTSNVTNMNSMFNNCRYLKTIKVPSTFVTTSVTDSADMFKSCNSLVGGAGTRFNANYIDATRAHIDGGTSNPGYFTSR